MKQRLKAAVPWPIKLVAKLIIARLPLPHRVFNKLGLFEHGSMRSLDYAEGVFRDHLARLPAELAQQPFSCLELGPGDSLFSALLAKANGAERVILVDVAPFASDDVETYRDAARQLGPDRFRTLPESWHSLHDVLDSCNATYLTGGLDDLRTVPDRSVDLVWSHAVLEHVRRDEFEPTMRECARVLTERGVASHTIDLRDHLQQSLNSLRFSSRVWESRLFQRSGFYTNRLRIGEIERICRSVGLEPEVVSAETWSESPLPRSRLAAEFRGMEDRDLLTWGCTIVTRREAPSG